MWKIKCVYHYKVYKFDGYDRNELVKHDECIIIFDFENKESVLDFIKNNKNDYFKNFEIEMIKNNFGELVPNVWYENKETRHKELR